MAYVQLVGLDLGSTTSRCLIASAHTHINSVSGRAEFSDFKEISAIAPVFTPFQESGRLNEPVLRDLISTWLSPLDTQTPIFGGAILTGLAAQASNAETVRKWIGEYLKEATIVAADDPYYESWLAFKGCVYELSKHHPDTWILNLDIGGGTTNFALGLNGEVHETSYLEIGARHFRFQPGTFTLTGLSSRGKRILEELGISELTLSETSVAAVLNYLIGALCKEKKRLLKTIESPVMVTLSGGVGEVVGKLRKNIFLEKTKYGDLGIEFAQKILDCEELYDEKSPPIPAGRATVYGVLTQNTVLSGTTIFVGKSATLPLTHVPILRSLTAQELSQLPQLLEEIEKLGKPVCVQLTGSWDLSAMKDLGQRVALKQNLPVVFLMAENLGHLLGNYLSDFGKRPSSFLVLDQIPERQVNFVNIGNPVKGLVPVSFFHLNGV